MKYQPFQSQKNDFFFAFLMAAVFMVTVVGEVAERRCTLKYQPFQSQKNDFFFAFLMAAVFMVTVVGEVAGYLSLARGDAAAEVARARQAPAASRSVGEHAPLLARVGAPR